MALIKRLFEKYKSFIYYIVFGVLTTLINIVVYMLCFKMIGISNVISNVIAWFFAVLFAFITNKIWVFSSESFEMSVIIYELISFFGCRIATGMFDIAVMYIFVDLLHTEAIIMKVISNVIVILLNYIASKLVIFKNA
ncbi:MAG: GtrA family protein [Bacteroidales bacterium]|nr:GtrA family protein [Bacteroidales bacterium]